MHKFKDLIVYQKALKFTKVVRQVVRAFPKEEMFGLTSQFRRAADSVVLNIAEGAGNSSKKEFSKFLDYSIRSGFESIGCLDIALENNYINESTYQKLLNDVNEIIAMLDGLQKSLNR
ncbi:MAG: four helix bundle protein [Ignavibacteria bacterium]|nr:four helix bundle protein [Ignavibacteria bacterium]